jgi:signal transduction histidine kinase/ligand-binding sensor domain-containing protein
MRKKVFYFFIFLLFFKNNIAFSQAPEFNFQRIGVNEGLSQGSVRDILEDKQGFLWFATADGLNRYDGYDFHTYNHHGEDSTSIISGDVYKIFKDANGDLWLSTAIGLCKYKSYFDKFQNILTRSKSPLFPLFENDKQQLFSINKQGSIFVHDVKRTNEIAQYPLPFFLEAIDKEAFFMSKDDYILFFIQGKLFIFNCTEKKWLDTVTTLKIDRPTAGIFLKNEFWIGNDKGELYHFDPNFELLDRQNIDNSPIASISSFGNADLIVGTSNGMFFYSPFSKIKNVYHYDANKSTSLSSNNIQSFRYDNSGNLWVGTNTSGLNKSIYNNKKFKSIISPDYYQVKAIWKDSETQELFCGVHKKGVDIYDLVAEQTKPTSIFSANNYIYIQPLNKKQLLLFYPNGVDILDRETNKISSYSQQLNNFFGEKVALKISAVCMNENKCYAYINQTVVQISLLDMSVLALKKIDKPLEVNALYVNKEDVFLGTNNGLLLYKNEKIQILINDIFVKSIYAEANQSLWVASTTGLFHYVTSTQTSKHYDDKYGLINNFIYGVLKDNNGNIWCSTNRGLARFNPQREYFRNYGLGDGIQAFEYNTGAFFKAVDGTLIFGGVGGINYFNTDMIAENPVTPKPLIVNLRVNDDDFKTDTCIWYKKYIELSFSQNTISFDYVGLQYSNTERNEYQYQLVGVDKDWIYAGNRRFARYANLEPGTYIFKVKAANSDGRWNSREAILTIKITTPFWMSWWFKALIILGVLGTLSSITFIYQQRKIRKQRQQLAIQERVISERERISRDLHDNIGAQITYIISSMDWAKSQIPKENEPLQERFDHLRTNTQSLMSSLRDTIWTLNKKAISPQDFFDRIRQYVSYNIQRNSAIEVAFFEQIESEKELLPNIVLNLFRICQEAIQNVVKHADAQVLTISIICLENEKLKISIADDGKGFDEKNRREDSFGLDNMRYRATEIGAELTLRSEKGKGTVVEIVL